MSRRTPLSRQPKTREGQTPSQRQLRVGELVRHAVADLLSRGAVHDPDLEARVITVPEVRMSPDLRNATVFVVSLGGSDDAGVVAALKRNARYIRGEIARAVDLRNAPRLDFKADHSFDEAGKINALLARPDVRRDTERD
ncbi:MAG: 30S ribosome-binding factor RbfA [Pseudomonadota bacterium]